jgi:integrase
MAAASTSRCERRKPYGTRPSETDVAALIHKLRCKPRGGERLSFAAIANPRNAEGHPTRTGLANACETHAERLTVWTFLDTALRISELAGLRRDHIDWQYHRLTTYG